MPNNKYRLNVICLRFGILLAVFHMSSLHASESFWQSPQSQTYRVSNAANDNGLEGSLLNAYLTELDGRRTEQTTLALSQNFGANSSLSFEYANAHEQRNLAFGITQGSLSVSYMAGSGEDYARISGDYTGIGPYLFHAGYKQKYQSSGFALDYDTGRLGRVQYGEAEVVSNGLLDRKSRYLEWSNSRFFARSSRFERDSQHIGKGFDFGVALGSNADRYVALQLMDLEDDKRMQRIRLQFNGRQSRQYWLDLSAHQNPLYQAGDDYQMMINFKTLLGRGRAFNHYSDEAGSGEAVPDMDPQATNKKTAKGWKRAAFIGAGAAAAAALSSSGSETQDQVTRFRTQTEAAFNVLNEVNPRSISLNTEFGGWVFINADGSYTSTAPAQGDESSVMLPALSLAIPPGAKATATYHTHAAFDPRFDNENFSPQDLENDREVGVDGYLATPGGQFKFHDVTAGTVTTIGTVATQ